MAYNKVFGAGNNAYQYVFKIYFDQPIDSAPKLKAWDDTTASATTHEVLAGTTGNGNVSMVVAIETTSGAPSSNWASSVSQTSGGTSPNRLKGDDAYLLFPNTNQTQYFNLALEIPYDATTGGTSVTDHQFALQVECTFSGTEPNVTIYYNNATAGGDESSPSWSEWSTTEVLYPCETGSSTTEILNIIATKSGTKFAPEYRIG